MKTIVSLVCVGASALVLAACGGGGSATDAGHGIDGAPGGDAPHLAVDAAPGAFDARLGVASCYTGTLGTAPATVQVAGESVTIDLSAQESLLPGVNIAAYRSGYADPLVTTISSQEDTTSGQFGLTIPTNGAAVDGYLLGTYPGYLDTYLYPPGPITGNLANAAMLLVTSSTLRTLGALALGNGGPTLDATKGVIGIVVLDSSGAGVAGATVTTTPSATVAYNDPSLGFPSPSATATASDGAAYAINVDPGCVTISVTVSGQTYGDTQLRTYPASGAITTTALTPSVSGN